MAKIEFSTLVAAAPGGASRLPIPREASAALGTRVGVTVRGTVNGRPFKAAAVPDGKGTHFIAVDQALRVATGVRVGDLVRVVLQPDAEDLAVEVPPDFLKAVTRNVLARPVWERFPPSHKRAYLDWVADAKKVEVRAKRIEEAVQRIALGKQLR
jgi:hypothetical protein